MFGITGNPKIILYLPTYRRLESEMFSFSGLSYGEIPIQANKQKNKDSPITTKLKVARYGVLT